MKRNWGASFLMMKSVTLRQQFMRGDAKVIPKQIISGPLPPEGDNLGFACGELSGSLINFQTHHRKI
jgi:hypothetical protein